MAHKIIFLNGPPGSGKDEGACIITRNFSARPYKMSGTMKFALKTLLDIPTDMVQYYNANKELPFANLGDLSWRELQISFAEEWIKPILGNDIFGKLAVQYLSGPTSAQMTVISDSGFKAECLPLVKYFKPSQCLLIQLTREGCTFENDSRSYIELDNIGVVTVEVNNKYPLVATADNPITYDLQLAKVVREWLVTVDGET